MPFNSNSSNSVVFKSTKKQDMEVINEFSDELPVKENDNRIREELKIIASFTTDICADCKKFGTNQDGQALRKSANARISMAKRQIDLTREHIDTLHERWLYVIQSKKYKKQLKKFAAECQSASAKSKHLQEHFRIIILNKRKSVKRKGKYGSSSKKDHSKKKSKKKFIQYWEQSKPQQI